MPRVWFLRVERHGELYFLYRRVLLQCDGLVGRRGRLQCGLLLSDRVDIDYATDLPNRFVLPGHESQHDDIAHFALLPGERHERADRLRRWFIL